MTAINRTFAIVAAAFLALTALAGQAGSRNDGSRWIQLTESATLAGVKVPPGAYTLRWMREPGTESVKIEIAHGLTVLAHGKGRWIESAETSPYEALVYHEGHGANDLVEIRFRRSPDAIRIDTGADQADSRQSHKTDTN